MLQHFMFKARSNERIWKKSWLKAEEGLESDKWDETHPSVRS